MLDPLGAPTSMARLLSLMEDVATQTGLSSTAGAGASRLGRWVAKEDDDAVYLKVPMPGLTKEHVEVRADKNILVIKGEGEKQPWDGDDDDSAVPKYNRRIEVPAADAYKMDKIKAEMKNGVLIVAMFPVRWERGTGTRDESRWLKKIGYNEGIHLSNDFFIAGTRSNPFGYDEPGTVPWVEERSS